MKKTLFAFLTLSGMYFGTFAQRQPDNIIDLKNHVQEINIHQITGIPIAVTNESYYGIDPNTNKTIWKVDRALYQKLSNLTETEEDFFEVALTPYAIINNNLVDVRTGKLIIDKTKDNVKRLKKYDTILPLGLLLIEGASDGIQYLFCVDLNKTELKWKAKIGTTSMLKDAVKGAIPENPFTTGSFKTLYSKAGNFIYKSDKHLISINGNDGSVMWDLNINPGQAFFNNDESRLMVVDKGGSMVSMLKNTMTMNLNKLEALGKEVTAIDPQTGKTLFELKLEDNYKWTADFGNEFFIANTAGGNLYSYENGQKKFKKDFDEKRIQDIQKMNEGYLISYKNEQMLVDQTGKKLWKKPVVLEDVSDDVDYDRYEYQNGYIIAFKSYLGYYIKDQKKPVWKLSLDEKAKLAYDQLHKNILILDGEKYYIINPEKSAEKPKALKVKLKDDGDSFNVVDIKPNSYFFSGPFEYFITDISGNIIKQKYFKEPGGLIRQLANAGSVVLAAAAVYQASAGVINMEKGIGQSFCGLGESGEQTFKKGVNQYNSADGLASGAALLQAFGGSRYNAFGSTPSNAYYFTKGENNDKLLIRVFKENGDETDKLIFLNNKPVYQIDYISNKVFYLHGNELQIFNNK
jgi:outer membrane protein assembly factor BamB